MSFGDDIAIAIVGTIRFMEFGAVKRNLIESYDRGSNGRAVMTDAAWKQAERDRFLQLLTKRGQAGQDAVETDVPTLLEIGAGHGVSGRFFADQGIEVTCTDLSPEHVQLCKGQGLNAEVMDFAHLEFPKAHFDAVFGMNCLLHVPRAELQTVLASIGRVLKPGGVFYWGQYGGTDFEGVWEKDSYEPKRFFSFLEDEQIQSEALHQFDIVDFSSIQVESHPFKYQALTLLKR